MLVTECQSEFQLAGALVTAGAKFSLWRNSGCQTDTAVNYQGFFSYEFQSDLKDLLPQLDFDPWFWPYHRRLSTISAGRSDWLFDLTTCTFYYCSPKVENLITLIHTNILNYVSNNCLVLTYK